MNDFVRLNKLERVFFSLVFMATCLLGIALFTGRHEIVYGVFVLIFLKMVIIIIDIFINYKRLKEYNKEERLK